MSKAFDTKNIHTLIRKLLQTMIPGTIIKLIANYIKGCNAYTTHRNNTFSQRQFKTGVPQGCVLSPALFNIYTAEIPPPRAQVLVMAYADGITISSTHKHACSQEIHTTIHTYSFCLDKTKQSHTKSRQTTWTLYTPDPAEYKCKLDLKINNTALPMVTHPKVLGLTLDPKLIYSIHIHNISVHAHNHLQIIKPLIATGWGKQKETLMATYKAVTGSGVCLCHMCILNQQITSHVERKRNIENCHRIYTNIQHSLHSHFPYMSTYSSSRHNINRKQNIPYTNKHYTSPPQCLKTTIFNNGHYTTHTPQTPHFHYNRHKNKHASYTCIYCL